MPVFSCRDCPGKRVRPSLTLAFSDADWHNTETGHDVQVRTDTDAVWELTENGWIESGKYVAGELCFLANVSGSPWWVRDDAENRSRYLVWQ